jgi:hypothetical protein
MVFSARSLVCFGTGERGRERERVKSNREIRDDPERESGGYIYMTKR